ncbi:uncharacterized mitochondrial protein-like protein [Tanacetum coccineum]
MPAFEDDSIFDFSRDDEDDGVVADMKNLDTTIQVSPNLTIRIHKDHPLNQVIRDFQSAIQTRKMSNDLEEHGFVIYVDDIIFGSTKMELCIAFEKLMHEKFQMSSMGELTFFLGLQVKQKKDGIFISQDKYVDEILKKFRFTEVKTASTPMETQKPLLKDEDGEEVDVHMYRSMIGSLMYLTSSRPDIMFAVCACTRYQVNPKVSHLYAMKRIFSFFARLSEGIGNLLASGWKVFTVSPFLTYGYRLISSGYQSSKSGSLKIDIFIRSLVVFNSEGMLLSQRKYAVEILMRAHMVGCNPCRTPVDSESKLGADGDSVSHPTLFHSLVGALQYLTFTRLDLSYALLWYCNNVSAVYLSTNLVQHQRTKHIEIDIHFVRDMVVVGMVRVLYVPSRYEYAYILTKGLPSTFFEEFRTSLSIRYPPVEC